MRFVSQAARDCFGLGDGGVSPGAPANCALFEEDEWVVGSDGYETKCRWSPFHGRKTRFRSRATVLNGKTAYRDGDFIRHEVRCLTG